MEANASPTIFQRWSLASHASSARVTIIDIARFNQFSDGATATLERLIRWFDNSGLYPRIASPARLDRARRHGRVIL
jgi:hypothetical protein